MVSVITTRAVERWQRKIVFRSRLSIIFQLALVFLAAVGLVPIISSFFQDPLAVNVWLCAGGVIATLTAIAALGFYSERRVRPSRSRE